MFCLLGMSLSHPGYGLVIQRRLSDVTLASDDTHVDFTLAREDIHTDVSHARDETPPQQEISYFSHCLWII